MNNYWSDDIRVLAELPHFLDEIIIKNGEAVPHRCTGGGRFNGICFKPFLNIQFFYYDFWAVPKIIIDDKIIQTTYIDNKTDVCIYYNIFRHYGFNPFCISLVREQHMEIPVENGKIPVVFSKKKSYRLKHIIVIYLEIDTFLRMKSDGIDDVKERNEWLFGKLTRYKKPRPIEEQILIINKRLAHNIGRKIITIKI